jgi:hypothetical protein
MGHESYIPQPLWLARPLIRRPVAHSDVGESGPLRFAGAMRAQNASHTGRLNCRNRSCACSLHNLRVCWPLALRAATWARLIAPEPREKASGAADFCAHFFVLLGAGRDRPPLRVVTALSCATMSENSIEAEAAAAVGQARCIGVKALSVGDYCRLAEECFFLAAVAKDADVAAELLKAGDEYLRGAGAVE